MSVEASRTARDEEFVRRAIAIGRRARDTGNQPFGALLVTADGQVLAEGQNTEETTRDCTGHAETNAVRDAGREYDADVMAGATLYSSNEPCPMCAAAIFWSGVRRLVYGLSGDDLYDEVGALPGLQMRLSARELYARCAQPVEVVGPMLRDEALALQEGYWT